LVTVIVVSPVRVMVAILVNSDRCSCAIRPSIPKLSGYRSCGIRPSFLSHPANGRHLIAWSL